MKIGEDITNQGDVICVPENIVQVSEK